MASSRARGYMSADGADATLEELARALQPHAEMIVSCNGAIYSSITMNIGINIMININININNPMHMCH